LGEKGAPIIGLDFEGGRRFADPIARSRIPGAAKLSLSQGVSDIGTIVTSQEIEYRYFDKTLGANRKDTRFTTHLAFHYKINDYLTLSPSFEFLHSVSNRDNKNFDRIEAGPILTVKFGS